MNRLVYLFELDSVRNTEEEIKTGQQAMFEEIAENGNSVVLSFNQLTDSHAFIAAVKAKKTFPHILELFKSGALRVSHYGKMRTPSQYLQNSIEKCQADDEGVFIFSALPLMSSQKDLLKKILAALRYSDPAILTEMMEEKQAELESAPPEQTDDLKSELEALDFLERYVRMILLLSTEPLSGNKPVETDVHPFSWYMKKALEHYSRIEEEVIAKAVEILKAIYTEFDVLPDKRSVIENRSNWVMKLYELENSGEVCMAEAIVDLCYNYTVEESVSGVSRHFEGADCEQLMLDFDKRLKKYWDDHTRGAHKFHTGDSKRPTEYTGDLPHWVTAERLYAAHTKRPSGDGSTYESGFRAEKRSWKRKIIKNLLKTLCLSLVYIVLLVVIDVIMNYFQDLLFSSDEEQWLPSLLMSGLSSLMFGVIGSVIALAPWLPDFLDVFRSIFHCFQDVLITKFAPKNKAYRNTDITERDNDEH